jgi:hypothetical protein
MLPARQNAMKVGMLPARRNAMKVGMLDAGYWMLDTG